jgi:Bacterial protein of unknown function (DUF924)
MEAFLAAAAATEGVELGRDRELGLTKRNFFWLTLGHSEDLTLHERSMEHAEEAAANAPPHLKPKAPYEFGPSGQGCPRRHRMLRAPPTSQRGFGAYLDARSVGVTGDRDAAARRRALRVRRERPHEAPRHQI